MDQVPLGREVGLGPSDVVLDGDPAPPPQKGGTAPSQFSADVYCGQTTGWIKMAPGVEVGLGPGHIVLDGDPASISKKGAQPPLNVRPMSIVTKRLDGSKYHMVGR